MKGNLVEKWHHKEVPCEYHEERLCSSDLLLGKLIEDDAVYVWIPDNPGDPQSGKAYKITRAWYPGVNLIIECDSVPYAIHAAQQAGAADAPQAQSQSDNSGAARR